MPPGPLSSGRTTLIGDVAAVSQIPGQVDRRHPAGADLALEGVAFAECDDQTLEGVGHWKSEIYCVR